MSARIAPFAVPIVCTRLRRAPPSLCPMGSLLPDVDEWELRTGGDDFGALEGLSLDDGFLFDMLDDTGTSFDNNTPPTGISDGSGGVGGGGGTLVASYSLRCIDESHPVDCSRCGLARRLVTVGLEPPAQLTCAELRFRPPLTHTRLCSCTPAPEDPDQVELLGDRGRKVCAARRVAPHGCCCVAAVLCGWHLGVGTSPLGHLLTPSLLCVALQERGEAAASTDDPCPRVEPGERARGASPGRNSSCHFEVPTHDVSFYS